MKKIVRQKPDPTDGRATIVRSFDIPVDLNYFTREEANQLGLGNLTQLATRMGYSPQTLANWKRRHNDFPKPVGRLHESDCGCFGYVYSAHEVFTWAAQAIKDRRVWKPGAHKKTPSQ